MNPLQMGCYCFVHAFIFATTMAKTITILIVNYVVAVVVDLRRWLFGVYCLFGSIFIWKMECFLSTLLNVWYIFSNGYGVCWGTYNLFRSHQFSKNGIADVVIQRFQRNQIIFEMALTRYFGYAPWNAIWEYDPTITGQNLPINVRIAFMIFG